MTSAPTRRLVEDRSTLAPRLHISDAADTADILAGRDVVVFKWVPVGTATTALGENMEKYSNLRQFLA